MIAHFVSLSFLRASPIALMAAVIFMSVFLASVSAHAEETVDDTTLSLHDAAFEGTINFIHFDSFLLIIDDYSFLPERIVRFDGASWSREQVIKQLEQGDQVRLELGGIADDQSGARVVRSITVLNQ
ncbi:MULTISPECIES: hypothetical protein [Marinobacter]|uniref:hypothetical protein n=1 Tax=Marinobacter TaxID=2742 RepID=UPI001244DF7B|nr:MULTISPECIES: hypothetical protein [Marinobacter]MBL3558253.1 hypothetical protein [Marinobacter sp. JB05H06]